jgi:hypothetical protein
MKCLNLARGKALFSTGMEPARMTRKKFGQLISQSDMPKKLASPNYFSTGGRRESFASSIQNLPEFDQAVDFG